MLKVESVSRRYGAHLALEDVSFTAGRGEVIALLGRNGAGKSTLMNVLTGYIAMTSGRAFIAGYDVQQEAMAARRQVGYLPEQPPLYPDMTVREYLLYCTELKGIPKKKRRTEGDRVIELTGLDEYAGRLSGRLSKGYRQRLGLAQAMLGSPAVLILDEPGSGLDPLQMTQMRDLVREAGRESTVLLSSHLLSEVTHVCSRALVLEKGRLRYDGGMKCLLEGGGCLRAVVRGGEKLTEELRAMEGISEVRESPAEDGCLLLDVRHKPSLDLRAAVFHRAAACGAELLELTPVRSGLETAFLRLLDDEEAEG